MEAAFSYRPAHPTYGVTFSRSSTAAYVNDASDLGLAWWPGQLHLTATFSRASTASYVEETKFPESE